MSKQIELNSVFPNSIIGLVILNEQGEIEKVNDRAIELLGYKDINLIDSQFSNLVIESDKDKLSSYFSSADEWNEDNTIEIQIKKNNNEPIPIELDLICPESDIQKHYIGIIIDGLKRKLIEKEVKDLKAAKQEIFKRLEEEKELSELKSRFVTIASHEFRTPLAGVLSSLQLIRRYTNSEKESWNAFSTKDKIEAHFDKIEESVLNLNHILNDFLSLGKIEENKITCKYTWFNLPTFLNEMCRELEPLCKSGQKIHCNHYGENKETYLDKHILRNIINNIVSNAIKYSAENKTIQLTSRIDKAFLYIEIKDQGIGIPIAEHKHIFRRFFRAGNAVNFEGTGLGLNIVKKYTELMNGNITFESQENQPTTFFIKLPLNEKHPDEKNIINRR
jgi:PAS domain S-box-containing protein